MSKTGQNLLIISTNYIKTIKATTLFVVFLFVHSWEQRKLGEVAFYRRGSFPQPYGKKEWYDGNGAMSFVQIADVTDEMNLVENTKQKISTLAQPMSVYADKNSVLVTLQGSIGRVAITQYGAFIDRTVLIFEKYKEPINILFWAYIIKQKFIEEAHKAPGGTIKTITKEALSDFDLLLPKYDEQSRVGTFFKQLDNLITLHQREVFSKNIIFKNIKFGGLGTENNTSWEQRKLCEITTISKGQQINKAELENIGKYYVLNGGMTASGFTDKYNTLAGTISISEGGNSCGFVNFNSEPFWSGGHNYTLINPIINVRFLYQILKFIEPKIMALRVGSGLPNVQKNRLGDVDIVFPTNGEQKKIGLYLEKLDNLITLHQRQLEKLKNIKSALLDKMFV